MNLKTWKRTNGFNGATTRIKTNQYIKNTKMNEYFLQIVIKIDKENNIKYLRNNRENVFYAKD